MNWTNQPATEQQPRKLSGLGQETQPPATTPALPAPSQPELSVGKMSAFLGSGDSGKEVEVFTLSLSGETIELLPLRNWSQLDRHKWTARGRLPGEPAGLEVALDHVKILGESVTVKDPAGCEKLQRLFNEWLGLERETADMARKKAHLPVVPPTPAASAQPESSAPRFRVEVDKRGQVHIHCVQGKETLASIGLTTAGFSSLFQQGLMRKPQKLATGALHGWVELDGELCSFERGRNDSARLEQLLNERYLPAAMFGLEKQVVVFLNAASPTGFDIQFPIKTGGAQGNHRHHLNQETLDLLQDPEHCGLLHKGIIVKLIPPNLVFKQRTADGGEHYLPWGPETTVNVADDDGRPKAIPLSQPLNFIRLSPIELTAVFNHPALNRHSHASPPPHPAPEIPPRQIPPAQSQPPLEQRPLPEAPKPAPEPAQAKPSEPAAESAARTSAGPPGGQAAEPVKPLPNSWLAEILNQPALKHEWVARLIYGQIAERFGNSNEGRFGPGACWFVALGGPNDIEDPAFRGVFLAEKRSLGYLNRGQMARFCSAAAFVGPQEDALEGIQIKLVAVGVDAQERIVFIVSDDYGAKFGVQETELKAALNLLGQHGAVIVGITEALAAADPLEVVWTVPAEQPDPNDPQALESTPIKEG